MSNFKVHIVDKNNHDHLKMINDYEIKKRMPPVISNYIQSSEKTSDNEINLYLFTNQQNSIKDVCHLYGVKDIKICSIEYPIIKGIEESEKKIVIWATEYAISVLGMEEVFVKVSPDNSQLKVFLQNNNYENLGIEDRKIIFLKENKKDYKRHIHI